MRRRLLAVLLPLAVLMVAALGVPLGVTVAQREMQETYVDRLNDVGRFASLAETGLSTGRTEALDAELARYHELYGIPAALLEADGAILLGPGQAFDEAGRDNAELGGIVTAALAGARSEPSSAWWPWDDSPLIVAEPVGRDSEVVGVVVTISDIERTRDRVLARWAQLAGLGLVPLLALLAVAWPVSSWILRPVRELDNATAGISRGDLTIRADAVRGPVELRRLAGSFNTMMDAVENAVQRQRAFISDASHQLRNPLTSLRLAVESLQPHLRPRGGQEAYEVAVDEVKSMHRMLNSLLASARMESMRTAEPVDLDTVLATRLERWRVLATAADLALSVDVPPGLRLLEPPGGLGSILDELVSNALRLSGGQTVEIAAATVTVPGPRPDGEPPGLRAVVEVAVRDDGSGIDPAERRRAVQRFWRSPRHQNVAGTGLGLAICSELAATAGGGLELREGLPRPGGHGLAAVVVLPAAPDPEDG